MEGKLKKILIVDDEPLILFGLSRTFKDVGEVKTVDTGEKACEEISSSFYDLCIVDIYLPGLNGIEVIDHILKVSPETKIVAMTAYADEVVKKEIINKSSLFLEKPFNLAEMKEMVKKKIV